LNDLKLSMRIRLNEIKTRCIEEDCKKILSSYTREECFSLDLTLVARYCSDCKLVIDKTRAESFATCACLRVIK
jgi:hypothetical protein